MQKQRVMDLTVGSVFMIFHKRTNANDLAYKTTYALLRETRSFSDLLM